MATYVWRNGVLIDVRTLPPRAHPAASAMPAPAVHGFESYASPIDDATISSHRQRDRDLHASGSYDPRDTPASFKKARDGRRKLKQPAPKP